MVHNKEEAEKLLSYTLYPPYGKRGCGPQRAIRYGFDHEPTYYETSRKDLCRFLQIECASFIDDLEEVAKNPYIDGFIIGFADLSASINEAGNSWGEKNIALAKKAIEICKRHGKMVGTATLLTDEKTIQMFLDMGLTMITCGADWKHILDGARETYNALRKVIKE
jgi:2-keto-3-deoxy-L-rhamnonate aldolase RhmA